MKNYDEEFKIDATLLFYEILYRAVQDLYSPIYKTRMSAYKWLKPKSEGLNDWCDNLDMDIHTILNGIYAQHKAIISDIRTEIGIQKAVNNRFKVAIGSEISPSLDFEKRG